MSAPRRLRIAYVVDTFDGRKNGGTVSAVRFVEGLRARHDVTVVTTGAGAEGRVVLPSFYPPFFARVMREMGFVFAVPRRRTLEEVFRRSDVVHVQFPFWLGMRAAAVARRLGTPLVAAFHVQPENMFLNIGIRSGALEEWTYRLFISKLFSRADALVCPSAFALGELRRRGVTVPAEVVSNGIAPRFRPGPAERSPRHEGKRLVLAVGRLAKEKRHDVVIEGVRRSRHARRIQLVITGRGPEEERIRRAGATLPVPAEVLFASDDELLRLYRTADVLVHASEVELEGMAVLEALGCGTPALVADAPRSAARQLALAPELLFRSGDPADLARRLDAVLEDPARLAAARARAVEVAAGLSVEASVRRLEALYLRVVTAKAAGLPAEARDAPAARSTAPPGGR